MPKNANLYFFGHFLGGDTMRKKSVVFEDKCFAGLVIEIRDNCSNAINNTQLKMGRLLRENGYKWSDFGRTFEGGGKLIEREQADTMPSESSRIVSTGRKSISKEKVNAIIKMGSQGFTEREIAKTLQVGKGTVGKYLNSVRSSTISPS